MALTRRVPTPRTRCNRHHCWQCSSRCCRCRCCSPAVHRVRMDECRLLLPWGWWSFHHESREVGNVEQVHEMFRRRPPGSAASCRLAKSFRMCPFGKTLNYLITALITLITTLDTVYQRPWHLIGAGPPKGGRSRIPPSVKSGSRNAESGSVLCTWGLCTARVCSGSDRPMVRRCW